MRKKALAAMLLVEKSSEGTAVVTRVWRPPGWVTKLLHRFSTEVEPPNPEHTLDELKTLYYAVDMSPTVLNMLAGSRMVTATGTRGPVDRWSTIRMVLTPGRDALASALSTQMRDMDCIV